MATEHKPITAYLPSDLELALEEYCKSNGLIRKSRTGEITASMGTGIVKILEEYFNGKVLEIKPDNLDELLAPYLEKVNQQIADLRAEFTSNLNDALAELSVPPVEKPTQPMTPVEVDEEKDWQYPQPQIHTDYEDYRDDTTEVELTEDSENLEENSREDDQEDTQNQVKDESPSVVTPPIEIASLPEFKDGLSQTALARRFNVSDSTVFRNRVKSEEAKDDSIFANWSQKKDPDHIAWRYSKQNEKYYPIG